MTYQPETHDYRVHIEQLAPEVFAFHFWQYTDSEWHFLYRVSEVMAQHLLKEHCNLYSADGYNYWRRE